MSRTQVARVTNGAVTLPTYVFIDPIAHIDPALVKNDPARRLSRTPWGPGMGVYRWYGGLAVPWKKNPEGMKGHVGKKGKDLYDWVMNNLARVAKEVGSVKGVAIGSIEGRVVTAPLRSFKVAERWGKKVEYIATADKFAKLLPIVMPGAAPRIPAVVTPP